MAIRTYKVTLDSKNTIAPEPVFLRQGDKTGAVVIDATLMDNGTPVSLSGLTPMFKANTADGQAVIADSTGFNIVNASGGEFTYQVPNALSAVPGKIKVAYFSLLDSSGAQSTFNVVFFVEKAADMTQENAKDWVSNLNKIIDQYNQWVNNAHSSWQDFVNENKEIIESIDPGGTLLTEIIDARKPINADAYSSLGNRLNEQLSPIAYSNKLKTVDEDPAFDNAPFIKQMLLDGNKVLIKNGEYNISSLLSISIDLESENANIPIQIEGESPNGVVFTSTLDTIMDFRKSKHVFLKNLSSDKFIGVMNYGTDESLNSQREVVAKNVFSTAITGEPINWYNFINTPAPSSYDGDTGGMYSRYALEIQNWAGYNPVMITNHANSVEASPIGITDTGTGPYGGPSSSPTILIDQSNSQRPLLRAFKDGNDLIEISDGSLALGARVSVTDGGFGQLKVRGGKPRILLLDNLNNDKGFYIEYENGFINIKASDTMLFKFNDSGELLQFAPNGISTNLKIRDASGQRGLQFQKVSTNQYRIVYTDSANELRTNSYASVQGDDAFVLQTNKNGTTANRPVLRNSMYDIGYQYFDTDLQKPIWWGGSAWKDATGTTV